MDIKQVIIGVLRFLKNLLRRIINGVLNFFQHVVAWFKNLNLDPNKHVPFIANAGKIKDMLKVAPVKNVGIFKGVYNEQTEEIDYHELVEADNLDLQSSQTLGNEPLVVLN